jgi:hypothetical protein
MVNGRYDSFFPVETSQKPFHDTSERRRPTGSTSSPTPTTSCSRSRPKLAIRETLDWLDRHLGPVGR